MPLFYSLQVISICGLGKGSLAHEETTLKRNTLESNSP
ncbi:hypothetical protein C1G87_1597 [Dehalococcoides mccartyi]|uniref:Uncharacterized protein n=1 Tax=Dehalococcoides mccartyi TaxID=61435 RepID=A0A328ENB9_9CHLR|nr:hypothetical protein C1G87_1597 [Dehalococcoides mccartyi]